MMLRLPWLDCRPEDERLTAQVALLPLDGVALAYRVGSALHRSLFEGHWLRRRRLPCAVVSVGNLIVGGAGKTPTAAWLAARLLERGHRVVLASRGYRRRSGDPVTVVSDGRFVLADSAASGDEARLLAAHAPGVPVLVGRDRGVVGLRACSAFAAEVLVLDDGLQHHRLARDIEITIFDGALGFGNRRLLPRGPLRESLAVLSRSHAVGIVDGPLPQNDSTLLARMAPDAFRFRARRKPLRLRPLAGRLAAGGDGLATLGGMKIGALASIARPGGFRRTLESLGAEVIAERNFRDHHRYRPRDLEGLERLAPVWITTEKDAVTILPSWSARIDLRVLEIELEVDAPGPLLDWLETRLAGC